MLMRIPKDTPLERRCEAKGGDSTNFVVAFFSFTLVLLWRWFAWRDSFRSRLRTMQPSGGIGNKPKIMSHAFFTLSTTRHHLDDLFHNTRGLIHTHTHDGPFAAHTYSTRNARAGKQSDALGTPKNRGHHHSDNDIDVSPMIKFGQSFVKRLNFLHFNALKATQYHAVHDAASTNKVP